MYKKLNSFVYKLLGFLNNSVRMYPIKLKIDMRYHMSSTFQNTFFHISVNVLLKEKVMRENLIQV